MFVAKKVATGVIPSDYQKFLSGKYAGRSITLQMPSLIDEPDRIDNVMIRYELTGRSESSKSRQMYFLDGVNILHHIKSSEPFPRKLSLLTASTKETDAYKDAYQIYKAGQVLSDGEENYTVIVTNGHHTENLADLANTIPEQFAIDKEKYIRRVLDTWGAETDGPNGQRQTSRIAMVLTKMSGQKGFDAVFGAVDRYHNITTQKFDSNIALRNYNMTVSTYSPDNPWMDIPVPHIRAGTRKDELFNDHVGNTWNEAKKRFVMERGTGKQIPTLTSIAYMNFDFKDDEGIFAVRNMCDKKQ